MADKQETLGDAIEDEYYASGGVRTGTAYNEYLVSQRERMRAAELASQSRLRAGERSRAMDDNEGTRQFFLGLIGLAVLFLAAISYFYSATVVFNYWTGFSRQNFSHFAIYSATAVALLLLVSRFFGFIAGFTVGLIAIIPVIHSMTADTGFHWIVFRSETTQGATRFLRLCSLVSVLVVHGVLIWNLASRGRSFRAQPGWWWSARGMPGRTGIALLVASGIVLLAIVNLVAVWNF